jgi:hypothetical protein
LEVESVPSSVAPPKIFEKSPMVLGTSKTTSTGLKPEPGTNSGPEIARRDAHTFGVRHTAVNEGGRGSLPQMLYALS